MGFFFFFEKRTKSCFSLKTSKETFLLKKNKKTGGLFFFEKKRFCLNPAKYIEVLLCVSLQTHGSVRGK